MLRVSGFLKRHEPGKTYIEYEYTKQISSTSNPRPSMSYLTSEFHDIWKIWVFLLTFDE